MEYAVRHHTVSLGAKYFPDLLEIRKERKLPGVGLNLSHSRGRSVAIIGTRGCWGLGNSFLHRHGAMSPQPPMKTSLRHELWRAVRDSRNGRHACLRDRVHVLQIRFVENGVRRNTPPYSVRTLQLTGLQKRWGPSAAISMLGAPSRLHSAMSFPVTGPSVRPIIAWPVATNRPCSCF